VAHEIPDDLSGRSGIGHARIQRFRSDSRILAPENPVPEITCKRLQRHIWTAMWPFLRRI